MSGNNGNPLAKQELPAHLQKYYREDSRYDDQLGQLDRADLGISFVKLVHGSSKEATKGWGQTGAEPAMPIGTMFISGSHRIIAPDTEFIPLIRTVSYIHWEGRPGDGRILFMANDKNDPRILKIDGLTFKKDPNTGDTIPPPVTTYVNFWILTKFNMEEPIILSFYRTALPLGRDLTRNVMRATKGNKLPLFALKYKLKEPRIVVDGDNRWPQFVIESAGYVDKPDLAAHAEKLAKTAAELNNMSREEFAHAVENEGGGKENVKQVDAKDVDLEVPNAPPEDSKMFEQEAPKTEPRQEVKQAQTQAAPAQSDGGNLW